MKVLIVEDSESVRQTIKRVIRAQVDEFVECSDGFPDRLRELD